MTYGSNDKNEATLHLSPKEHEEFRKGKTIKHIVGCNRGTYKITVRMTKMKETIS
jgi:hypothetical protein